MTNGKISKKKKKKMLKKIARMMSKEATKFFEEDVKITKDSIIKLPTCVDYDEKEIMYACQYNSFAIIADIIDGKIEEVKVVG